MKNFKTDKDSNQALKANIYEIVTGALWSSHIKHTVGAYAHTDMLCGYFSVNVSTDTFMAKGKETADLTCC